MPGHMKVEGTAETDSLAMEGALRHSQTPEPAACAISVESAKKAIKDRSGREHRVSWKKLRTQEHSKPFLVISDRRRKRRLNCLPCEDLKLKDIGFIHRT